MSKKESFRERKWVVALRERKERKMYYVKEPNEQPTLSKVQQPEGETDQFKTSGGFSGDEGGQWNVAPVRVTIMVNVTSSSKDGNALYCEAKVANEGKNRFADIIRIKSIMVKMHDGTVRTIRDVRHVESLKKNLLSLGQLDDLGCKVEIQNKIMKIINGALVLMRVEKVAADLCKLKGEIMEETEASVA
ncbi:hypothetical protein Tco_0773537 [Tanacetum coccineum]|uniref:Retrovirus-related Pol polyprotein from transposon TNT 1-94-like beta-barrel domain-containing protein n=1 Tax=Tanacetum coccineum TaxID=301880 RepID=A0ABQ4ZNL3_9ASTR